MNRVEQPERSVADMVIEIKFLRAAEIVSKGIAIGASALAGAGILLMDNGQPVIGASLTATAIPVAWRTWEAGIELESNVRHTTSLIEQLQQPRQQIITEG